MRNGNEGLGTDIQKQYEQARENYFAEASEADQYSSYRIKNAWRKCIEAIFEEALPRNEEEFAELLSHPLTLLSNLTQAHLGHDIWNCLGNKEKPHVQYAINRYTEKLVEMAVTNEPGARHIDSVTSGFSRNNDAYEKLAKRFPRHAEALLQRVITEKITVDTDFLEAFSDIDTEDLRKILPDGPNTLLALVKRLDGHIGEEYLRMVNSFTENGRATCHWNQEHPVRELLDLLPEPYLGYTIKNMNKMFTTGNEHFSRGILNSGKATPQMQERAIAYLCRMVNPPDIILAKPYRIPQKLSGEALCKVLIFLDEHLKNPAQNIEGLPTREELSVRTIEIQITAQQSDSLYVRAVDARDKLEPKVSGQTTSCNALLHILKNIVIQEREREMASDLKWCAMNRDIFFLIISWTMDLRKYRRSSTMENLQAMGFDNILWFDQPTEQQAFEAVTIFTKHLPKYCTQATYSPEGSTA